MRSMRRVLQVLGCVAVLALLAGCANPHPTRLEPDAEMADLRAEAAAASLAERADLSQAAVDARVPTGDPGCSAAVGSRGEVLWAGAAGIADRARGIPITTETRFDMASVSKQFTATAILMLQREGELAVGDPVGRYVSGLPSWGASVTLDELIHHTSRLPDYWVQLDDVGIGFADHTDMGIVLAAIRRIDRVEPGSGFLYSNTNYVLLAEVVRVVSGQPLPEFLDERIFAPLDLAMTVQPAAVADDLALSYDDDKNLQQPGWAHWGHSGILTTPSELARWGDQYRAGDIIQDDFAEGAVPEPPDEQYGAGLDIEPDGDLNHTGRMGGYVSDFTVSADRLLTIAVMCNGHASDRFGIADALWAIWRPEPTE